MAGPVRVRENSCCSNKIDLATQLGLLNCKLLVFLRQLFWVNSPGHWFVQVRGRSLGSELLTTAAHMQSPHHGVVSILMSPLMVWAAIGMCWEGAVEGQGHGIMA